MAMKKRLAVRGGLDPAGRRKPENPLPGAGLIRPEREPVRLPSDLREDTQDSVLPHGVVLVIVILWLLFAAIMAWYAAHMPPRSS
jgi:hypothetical protein